MYGGKHKPSTRPTLSGEPFDPTLPALPSGCNPAIRHLLGVPVDQIRFSAIGMRVQVVTTAHTNQQTFALWGSNIGRQDLAVPESLSGRIPDPTLLKTKSV